MARPEAARVVLTVFMEGTANPMDHITTQIAFFSRICKGIPLSIQGEHLQGTSPGLYKLSFPGCGVSHGLRGTIFAVGLREQCEVVRTYVDTFVREGNLVTVNFVGLSRGGIGGLYLAQELDVFDKQNVLLNLLLFDPVPGNFIWMSRYLDVWSLMNANLAMDVSNVGNLGRVVVLYPHEPLPAIALHAPLLAKFPRDCQVETDVILGCHQGALWMRPRADTCLAFARIRDFLRETGSQIDCDQARIRELDVSTAKLEAMLSQELSVSAATVRHTHGPRSGAVIVRHESGQFLNRSHQELLRQLGRPAEAEKGSGKPEYMLDIVEEASALLAT